MGAGEFRSKEDMSAEVESRRTIGMIKSAIAARRALTAFERATIGLIVDAVLASGNDDLAADVVRSVVRYDIDCHYPVLFPRKCDSGKGWPFLYGQCLRLALRHRLDVAIVSMASADLADACLEQACQCIHYLSELNEAVTGAQREGAVRLAEESLSYGIDETASKWDLGARNRAASNLARELACNESEGLNNPFVSECLHSAYEAEREYLKLMRSRGMVRSDRMDA